MAIPRVAYTPKEYETVIVYMHNDYVGKRSNFVYRYTNWVEETHKWSQHEDRVHYNDHDDDDEHYEGDGHDHDRKKRATGDSETVVWIYPSADDLFDSEENIGGWIANSTAAADAGASSISFDGRQIYLHDDAVYYVYARVCNPTNPMECIYGGRTVLEVPRDWRVAIVLGILIPLVLIIAIVLIIVLVKHNKNKDKQRSMETGTGYSNKAFRNDLE